MYCRSLELFLFCMTETLRPLNCISSVSLPHYWFPFYVLFFTFFFYCHFPLGLSVLFVSSVFQCLYTTADLFNIIKKTVLSCIVRSLDINVQVVTASSHVVGIPFTFQIQSLLLPPLFCEGFVKPCFSWILLWSSRLMCGNKNKKRWKSINCNWKGQLGNIDLETVKKWVRSTKR